LNFRSESIKAVDVRELVEEPMKIKRQIIDDLDRLTPSEILTVYSMVAEMKRCRESAATAIQPAQYSFIRVRKALSKCTGSLGDDIISAREDRV